MKNMVGVLTSTMAQIPPNFAFSVILVEATHNLSVSQPLAKDANGSLRQHSVDSFRDTDWHSPTVPDGATATQPDVLFSL
jgi:hypothetical protein